MTEIVYLACAYSHPDPQVRRNRYIAATLAATDLMRQGYVVISPITMGHGYALADPGLPTAYDRHRALCEALMTPCQHLMVLDGDGVERSEGVHEEIAFFRQRGRPISLLDHRPNGTLALVPLFNTAAEGAAA